VSIYAEDGTTLIDTTTSQSDGSYSTNLPAVYEFSSYVISVEGGQINGVDFTGEMRAICLVDSIETCHITPYTTLLASLAEQFSGDSPSRLQQAATHIQETLGVASDPFMREEEGEIVTDVDLPAWRLSIENGAALESWIEVLQVDLNDGYLDTIPETKIFQQVKFRPDTTAPVITLSGNTTINLEQGTAYTEAGATATDAVDGVITVTTTGTVDTNTIGTYTVTYTATDVSGNQATAERQVVVSVPADTTAPVITLTGSATINIEQGAIYTDAGATASDAVDGVITVITTGTVNSNTVGTYTITYTATDESGNQATAQRQVVVPVPSVPSDTAAPVITLTGSATINLEQGTTYTEAGATASDAVDGVLVVTTTGTVNSNTVGSYTITYTATDGSGNQATAQRQVVVSVPPDTTAPVITLTGSATINLEQGTTYTEAGATATDAVDGVITVTTTGTVDTNTIGTYTVTYTATDVSGNQATAQRQVVVSALIVLNTPINIKLTLGGVGEITASWDAVTEAIKYQLCVAEEAIVTFSECVATHSGALTEETGITQQITALTSGTNYYFRVMALDDSGHLSLASVEVESKVLLKTLNDTGIYWGGNYPSGNNADCTGVEITQQDCSHGRDAQAAAGTLNKIGAGAAGFDFTKLDASGNALSSQNLPWDTAGSETNGTQWSCVKDNHTGLIWEVKTDVGGMDKINNIHHKDNTYQWGGITAIGKTASAPLGTYTNDWNGLVDGSNASNLCGFNDWRVPTPSELHSITHSGIVNPSIDTGYFPNTMGSGYWSSSPNANNSNNAWLVNFNNGNDNNNNRNNTYSVRLVRSGE